MLLVVIAFCGCSQGNRKTAVVAHRGYWNCEAGGLSENSIAALKAAQDNGFWGSECDVQLTADSVVIVNHNADINGAKISAHTYQELRDSLLPNGEHRPRLAEYLVQARKCTSTRLIIELKPQENRELEDCLVNKVLDEVKENGLFCPERVGFISFSLHITTRLAELAPGFLNQYLNGDLPPEALHSLGVDGLDYEKGILEEHQKWVEQARSLGMSTNVWTVDKREDIELMAAINPDAITTNAPLLVREVLGRNELR